MKKISIKRLTFIAIFSAISGLLYIFLKFNLPIFPAFLDVNLSMIPIIICTFMLGPIDASIVVLIRFVIKVLLAGSSTGYVGELADVLICLPTAAIAGSIYKFTNLKHKTLYAFISVSISWILFSVISNAFINIPFYGNLYGMEMVIGASKDAFRLISFGLIDNVNTSNYIFYYILFAVIPFNLMLSLVVIGITIPVHKRLKVLYDNL
jgi:riboflavin transporter FmnP